MNKDVLEKESKLATIQSACRKEPRLLEAFYLIIQAIHSTDDKAKEKLINELKGK